MGILPVLNRNRGRWRLFLTVWAVLSGYGLTLAQSRLNGHLEVEVTTAGSSRPTPVRVRLTRAGQTVKQLPQQAIGVMYGLWDHADGFGFQPDSSFYINGRFRIALPPGTYQLSLSKGPEFLDQQHAIVVQAGKTQKKTYRLTRWIDMAARGWYSTDGHIHIRRSPREDPLLMSWLQAEDVRVGVLLRMGDFWETYYQQYAFGEQGVYRRDNYLLVSGQEDPRTPELGHALGYGAADKVRYSNEYYHYDKVFDKLHELGGMTGYAHHAETFHGYRGLTLDGLRGKVDVLEILQYCVDETPLRTDHYYHLLDLGFPVTATAGSDFPWCGQDHGHGPPERSARIGNARFYVYTDGPLTNQSWKAGLKAGHTVATSGPMLDFRVNNARPGDRLDLKKGDQLTVSVQAFGHASQVPLDKVELIGHGKVLASVSKTDAGQSARQLTLKLELDTLTRGIWLAARCFAGPKQVAHTTPIYVTVDGGGFHNPETAEQYLQRSESYLREIEQELEKERHNPELRLWHYKKGLKTRIAETREVIAGLRQKWKIAKR
ncbi:CehA/McbA family metallohydrolase [Larkinella insperata]|uniref:CehA/McbA family metallohydrolase n=1 Tax=Larkinella insperata TaxID=332158 RepID=A0ABW3QK63_9BACT|nr:CehA/McbA family metallohydrolase [Larkinella insperata]